MRNNRVDMLSGPITKSMLQMIIPIMVLNLMQTLFNIIDMAVLGNMVDDEAVGAVGACGSLISLCSGTFTAISVGANVLVAKRIGEGNDEKIETAVGTSIIFSILTGFFMLVIGVSCAETFLRWTDCPEVLLKKATVYFKITFLGMPITMLYSFGAAILRASGDTRRPMLFGITGGIVKVISNIVFISVFNMTVSGVAIATIVSNAIACGLTLSVILRSKDKVHFSFKTMKMRLAELKEILFVGVPAGLHFTFSSLANVVMTTTVNSFGADATTGVSIANQFDVLLYYVSNAPSLATVSYVAQNIGAKNFKRAKESVFKSLIITVAFGLSLGILFAIFSKELSGMMSSTPAVIEYSCQRLILISLTYFICGINDVMGGALRGMGKPIIPTVTTLIFMSGLRFVWVYCIFPLCPNLTFLYLVWPVGWVLSSLTLFSVYFPSMRKLQMHQASETNIAIEV